MFRLIDPHAVKGGGIIAGNTADGDDAKVNTRPQPGKRLDARQRPQRDRDTVQTEVFQIGL